VQGFGVLASAIKKFQITNAKWFDKLTTLSQVEGQITMINPPPSDQTIGVCSYLRFGY